MQPLFLNDNGNNIIDVLKSLHLKICSTVREQINMQIDEELILTKEAGAGDVSYYLDLKAEKVITDFFDNLNFNGRIKIIAEGINIHELKKGENYKNLITIIIDPIDGTREIMYDKRSAWILTGVVLQNENATLADIQYAIQTEIPPSKQNLFSIVYAEKGSGAYEEVWDITKMEIISKAKKINTSRSTKLNDGFATFVDFFPGTKVEIAHIAESFFYKAVGQVKKNEAMIFDDQYITSGGQLYLLATGKYRLVVDLRGVFDNILSKQNKALGLCSHPYDLCTHLILQEAGGIILKTNGQLLDFPLDTSTNLDWMAFANVQLQNNYEKILRESVEHELSKMLK